MVCKVANILASKKQLFRCPLLSCSSIKPLLYFFRPLENAVGLSPNVPSQILTLTPETPQTSAVDVSHPSYLLGTLMMIVMIFAIVTFIVAVVPLTIINIIIIIIIIIICSSSSCCCCCSSSSRRRRSSVIIFNCYYYYYCYYCFSKKHEDQVLLEGAQGRVGVQGPVTSVECLRDPNGPTA